MEYTPISPFMRPISHAHLRVVEPAETSLPGKSVNKWHLLRELSKAQAAFGVSERDLTVLQGLLSFFPNDALDGKAEMVVFPSNKAICERLNGMPCSTMRRHLARLVEAGLLMRRDSPNGKRYIRRYGAERVTFGFDLTPLFHRSEEVSRAAEAVREAEDRVRRLREIISLMRRDLAALAKFGETIQPKLSLWDQSRDMAALTARALRRKLSIDDLSAYRTALESLLNQARTVIDGSETEEMNSNDARSERHHHNSNKDSIDFEPALENTPADTETPDDNLASSVTAVERLDTRQVPIVPLRLVLAACPALRTFYPDDIRHWRQLYEAACHLSPAMGINASAWEDAQRLMGREQASIVVAAILQRFTEIRSPGAYLRALTSKAASGEFSCGPMIMALIDRRNAA